MADDAEENPEIQEPVEETNENNAENTVIEEKEEEEEAEAPAAEETEEKTEIVEEAKVEEEMVVADNQSNNPPAEELANLPSEHSENASPAEAVEAAAAVEGTAEAGENVEAASAEPINESRPRTEPSESVPEGQEAESNAAPEETGAEVTSEPNIEQITSGETEATAESGEVSAEGMKTAESEDVAKLPPGESSDQQVEAAAAEEGNLETTSVRSAEGISDEQIAKKEEMHAHFEEDGERVESPLRVGEKLSREGSVTGVEQNETVGERLEPSTPTVDKEEEEEETKQEEELEEDQEAEEEEEEEEEMMFDRDLLIEKYRQAHAERQQLIQQNNVLQTKLAEYFRKKKADTESSGKSEMEKSIADQEQRYLKYIANLEDLRRQYTDLQEEYLVQIADLKSQCNEKQEKVDGETTKFMEFKKQVGLKSINSRSGKPIPPKELEVFLANEHRKETEVVQVRLKNIKLLNGLRKEEMALKSKEELAEGLHLIDFEQLKIENQTYNEKIEERNEELLKLRKKITSTVQVLTHLKEKLQFVLQENQGQRNHLNEVDVQVARERDLLTRTKQSRDALRIDNNKLRQNCGLLGNEALLRNFEDCVDTVDDKKKRLDLMRMEHAELTLNYNGLKRKIEQAKAASALGPRI